MPRSALIASVAAALAAVTISAGVIGSPVDPAGAAGPFSVTKSQFSSVKKTSILALKTSKANTKAIAALGGQVAVAAQQGPQGPKGDTGAPGGFDPTTITRIVGVPSDVDPADPSTVVTVSCPASSLAISGGWALALSADAGKFHVVRSYPSSPGLTSWVFRFSYDGPAATTVTPYAICAGI